IAQHTRARLEARFGALVVRRLLDHRAAPAALDPPSGDRRRGARGDPPALTVEDPQLSRERRHAWLGPAFHADRHCGGTARPEHVADPETARARAPPHTGARRCELAPAARLIAPHHHAR